MELVDLRTRSLLPPPSSPSPPPPSSLWITRVLSPHHSSFLFFFTPSHLEERSNKFTDHKRNDAIEEVPIVTNAAAAPKRGKDSNKRSVESDIALVFYIYIYIYIYI